MVCFSRIKYGNWELASIGHVKNKIIFIFIFAINKISIEELGKLQNLHYTAAPKEGGFQQTKSVQIHNTSLMLETMSLKHQTIKQTHQKPTHNTEQHQQAITVPNRSLTSDKLPHNVTEMRRTEHTTQFLLTLIKV